MRKILLRQVYENKGLYKFFCIVFFLGLIGGVVISNSLNSDEISKINNNFNDLFNYVEGEYDSFKVVVERNKIILIIFLFASTFLNVVVDSGILIYKGFSIGYIISVILKCFGMRRGILLSNILFIFQIVFYIPILMFFCERSINFNKKVKDNHVDIKNKLLKYMLTFMVTVGVISFITGVELSFWGRIFKKIQKIY